MDWFSLLLIIVFLVLPIIQQVIEQARRGQSKPEAERMPGLDSGDLDVEEASVETARVEPAREQSWSEEWAPWPGVEIEEPALEESPAVTTVSLEDPRPRAPERVLSIERYVERKPVSVIGSRAAAPIASQQIQAPRARIRAIASLDSAPALLGLRTTEELRRAMVLIEVLGPPVGLRQPE